jgi:hypothetical protein
VGVQRQGTFGSLRALASLTCLASQSWRGLTFLHHKLDRAVGVQRPAAFVIQGEESNPQLVSLS